MPCLLCSPTGLPNQAPHGPRSPERPRARSRPSLDRGQQGLWGRAVRLQGPASPQDLPTGLQHLSGVSLLGETSLGSRLRELRAGPSQQAVCARAVGRRMWCPSSALPVISSAAKPVGNGTFRPLGRAHPATPPPGSRASRRSSGQSPSECPRRPSAHPTWLDHMLVQLWWAKEPPNRIGQPMPACLPHCGGTGSGPPSEKP